MIDDKALLNALTTMFPDHMFSIKPVTGGRVLTIDEDPVARVRWVSKDENLEVVATALQQGIDQAVVNTLVEQITGIVKNKEEKTITPKLHPCLCGKIPEIVRWNDSHGGMGAEPDQCKVTCKCGLSGKSFYEAYDTKDGTTFEVVASKWWNTLFEQNIDVM
jgi:hypothetical protein